MEPCEKETPSANKIEGGTGGLRMGTDMKHTRLQLFGSWCACNFLSKAVRRFLEGGCSIQAGASAMRENHTKLKSSLRLPRYAISDVGDLCLYEFHAHVFAWTTGLA